MTRILFIDCRSIGNEHWSFNVPIVTNSSRPQTEEADSEIFVCLPESQRRVLLALDIKFISLPYHFSRLATFYTYVIRRRKEWDQIIILNSNPLHLITFCLFGNWGSNSKLYLHNEIFLFTYNLRAFIKYCLWRFAFYCIPKSLSLICSSRLFERLLVGTHRPRATTVVADYRMLEKSDWECLAKLSHVQAIRAKYLYLGSPNSSRELTACYPSRTHLLTKGSWFVVSELGWI